MRDQQKYYLTVNGYDVFLKKLAASKALEESRKKSKKPNNSLKITIVKQQRFVCSNHHCNKESKHRCSSCLSVAYCSKECSVIFWPYHAVKCGRETAKLQKKRLQEVD